MDSHVRLTLGNGQVPSPIGIAQSKDTQLVVSEVYPAAFATGQGLYAAIAEEMLAEHESASRTRWQLTYLPW
jgi:hypothetical protein